MPHELFLTAIVPDADAVKARSVLGGITEMRERHQFTRVRYLRRPDASPRGLEPLKELHKEKNAIAARWGELHQIFSRQSYLVQERVNITRYMANAEAAATTDPPTATIPADTPRLLRWNDLPDPESSRVPPFITQRRTLEISDRRLEKILADTRFSLVTSAPQLLLWS